MRLLSISAVMFLCVSGLAQNVEQIMQRHGLSWEEALAARLLADEVQAPIPALIEARRSTGLDIFRLAPAAVIQPRSPQNPAALHAKGQGWGVIAHRLGIHPGTFNKMRKGLRDVPDRDLEDDIWKRILIRRYGISESELNRIRKSRNWNDVVPAVHVSKTKRIKIDSLVTRRMESWDKYRRANLVPLDPPVIREKDKQQPTIPGLGKNLGKDDDKGKLGKDDDKGKGRGKGKGKKDRGDDSHKMKQG